MPKASEFLDQKWNGEVGVPPGGTRQHPDGRPADQFWLAADRRSWLAEGCPICTDAQDGYPVRSIATDFAGKLLGTYLQLTVGEFSCGCGRAMDEVGQPRVPVQEVRFFLG